MLKSRFTWVVNQYGFPINTVSYQGTLPVKVYLNNKSTQRAPNFIQASVRRGSSRPRESFDQLCLKIAELWETVVATDESSIRTATGDEELSLHMIHINGEIITGLEEGIILPQAGCDVAWINSIWEDIGRRARGDSPASRAWSDLIDEAQKRGWHQ
jgi:hypothetical protein